MSDFFQQMYFLSGPTEIDCHHPREYEKLDEVSFKLREHLWQIHWIKPFMSICFKREFSRLDFLNLKVKSELSITTLMKRIQKLTALSRSIVEHLDDQEIECKADNYYR